MAGPSTQNIAPAAHTVQVMPGTATEYVQEDKHMALNRSELVAAVAEKSGNSQAAVNGVLDSVFEVFTEQVSKGEKVTIPGWLAVERTKRAARTGRNPQTGETIQIPEGYSVKLSAGSKLKAAATGK